MFIIESLDVTPDTHCRWWAIESSWEFTNPTEDEKYACQVAKTLALKLDGDTHFRVVDEDHGEVIAVFAVEKRLIKFEHYGVDSETIAPGTVIPAISELEGVER